MTLHEPDGVGIRSAAIAQALLLATIVAAWSRSPTVFPEWAWVTDILLVLATLAACRSPCVPRLLSPLLAVTALLILVSNVAAPDAGAALLSTAAWARLLLAGLAGACLVATPHFVRRAAWFLAAAGAALSVHAAMQVFVIHPALAREEGLPFAVKLSLLDARGNSVFLLPAHLGAFLAVGLVAATALALGGDAPRGEPSRAPRALAAILALTSVVGLFLAASMGAALLVGLGLGSLALMGLSGRGRLAVLALSLVLPVAIVAPSRFRRQAEIAQEDPGSARAANWASAARIIREMPVLGCGGGGFALEHERVRTRTENDARHAHQGYLEAAAEHGLAMLPLLTCLVAAVGAGAWSLARRETVQDLKGALLHASAACVLSHALIDFGWSDPAWGLPAAILVGACLGMRSRSPALSPGQHSALGAHAGIAVVALLGLVVLGIGLPASAGASFERRALRAGEAGRHHEALAFLERAHAFEPLDATVPSLAAAAHLSLAAQEAAASSDRAEHVAAAVSQARRAVAASPRSAMARLTLARMLMSAGRRLEALAQASRAAQLAPHRADARELRDLLASQAEP